MNHKIRNLDQHYIICGIGGIGSFLVQQFEQSGTEFVIIEKDPTVTEQLEKEGYLVIQGDATEEACLSAANIYNAKGLAACLPKDPDNLFVVLTAKDLNENCYVVSKAIAPLSINKFKKAGADNTLLTSEMDGKQMALMLLNPSVEYSLEKVLHDESTNLSAVDIRIEKNSVLIGKELTDTIIKKSIDIILLGLEQKIDGKFKFNPPDSQRLRQGDTLTVIGHIDELKKLKEEANPSNF